MTFEVVDMEVNELLRSALEGNETSGPLLVSIFGRRLAEYVRLIGLDVPEVDRDLVCETAIERAVVKVHLYRPEFGSFDAWLRGFARHEIANWRRSSRRVEGVPIDEMSRPFFPEYSEPLNDDVANALRELTSQLSATDQLIIALREFERLPYAEIASRLDVRADACRRRHVRAIARLRALAEDDPVIMRYLEERR